MKPKLERAKAETREEVEADFGAETRRSAKTDAEKERDADKAGRERERETRAIKASCSSS